jgi:hypothetical protein
VSVFGFLKPGRATFPAVARLEIPEIPTHPSAMNESPLRPVFRVRLLPGS